MTPRRMAVAERNLFDPIPMVGTHNTTLTAVRATFRIPIMISTCPRVVL